LRFNEGIDVNADLDNQSGLCRPMFQMKCHKIDSEENQKNWQFLRMPGEH